MTVIIDTIDNADGFCPFSPKHNSTGIITSKREYISATSVDSAERDPVIFRILPSDSRLRTRQNSKWLNGNLSLPLYTTTLLEMTWLVYLQKKRFLIHWKMLLLYIIVPREITLIYLHIYLFQNQILCLPMKWITSFISFSEK